MGEVEVSPAARGQGDGEGPGGGGRTLIDAVRADRTVPACREAQERLK